jgi:hypothetical protein
MGKALEAELQQQLERLGPEQRREVLEFAQALAARRPRGVPGREITRFAGTISLADLDVMTAEIEAACEKVNLDEW